MCQQIKCVCVCVAINQEACARSAWCMVIMTILIRCKCVSRVHFTGSSRHAHPRGVERSSDASFLFSLRAASTWERVVRKHSSNRHPCRWGAGWWGGLGTR